MKLGSVAILVSTLLKMYLETIAQASPDKHVHQRCKFAQSTGLLLFPLYSSTTAWYSSITRCFSMCCLNQDFFISLVPQQLSPPSTSPPLPLVNPQDQP